MIPECRRLDPETCDILDGATHPGVPHVVVEEIKGQPRQFANYLPFIPADGIVRLVGSDGHCRPVHVREVARAGDRWVAWFDRT